jgi:hypothetical protein
MAALGNWYSNGASLTVVRSGREPDMVVGSDRTRTEDGGCQRERGRWIGFGFRTLQIFFAIAVFVVRRIGIGETEF